MPHNTSVSLSDHFKKFMDEAVASGQYGSGSEVIRDGLRLLQEKQQQIEYLRQALKEGQESGLAEPFSADEFLAKMHKKHGIGDEAA